MIEDLIFEAKRVLQEEINSLNSAKNRLSENFAVAVEMITKSNKVIVSGVGKSGIIARKIASTFSSIGVSSVFFHPVDALHGDLGMVQEGDVAILLSKSGSTQEIVNLVPYLKMRKAYIIAIVGNMQSFLSHNADIALDASVEQEACPFNLAPTSSAIVALALGDALAIACMKLKKVTIEDFSRLHPLGQIGRNITLQVSDVMYKNDFLPYIFPNATFRNAIIEITNKKLGCVCVVDNDFYLIGIITDGDVRRTLQKYEDIRGLKAKDVMTPKPITILQDAYLSEALSLMEQRESQISVLPVVDSDLRCIGVIRVHDIIKSGM